jgi:hypothetical protein
METEKPPSLITKVLAGGLLFFVWFIVLFPWIRYQYWQSDTFWLIETGRLIIEKHALPTHDPYSFTTLASHWTVYQWLTEVIFGLAHAVNGLAGVALLGGLLMAILLFVLMFRRLIKIGVTPIVAAGAVTLCVYSYCPDFSSLRPQLISFVLFWLMMVVCAESKNGLAPWKAINQTFIIAVIWANCHISFPVALLLLLANFAGTLLCFIRKRCDKKLPILFASMLTTFIIGTFFTPFGLALWSFIGTTHNMFFTQEVGPLIWTDQPLLMTLAFLTFLSCFYLRKKLDGGDLLTAIALILVGSSCVRLIVYFCIFSCPLIGQAASQVFSARLNRGRLGRLSEALKSVALSRFYILGVVLLTTFVVMGQATRIPRSIPIEAAKYLKEHPIAGNMFCSAHSGSYLIYSSHGAIPVFMDTRIDLYDPAFCKRFLQALIYADGWKELFSQYKIGAALLPNGTKLRFVLDQQPDWKAIYRDRNFSIFVPLTLYRSERQI